MKLATIGVWCLVALIGVPFCHAEPAEAPATQVATDPAEAQQAERLRLLKLASVLRDQGKPAEAVAAAEQMLAIERELFGKAHAEIVSSLEWIAGLHDRAGELDAAIKRRREASSLAVEVFGEKHWKTVNARLALADSEAASKLSADERSKLQEADRLYRAGAQLYRQGRATQAIEPAEQCASLRREVLGDRHRTYITALNLLATALAGTREYRRAEAYYLQTLEIRQQLVGDDHPDTATSLNNLAQLYSSIGDYAKAIPRQSASLAINRKILGDEDSHTVISLSNLAGLHKSLGDYDAAEPLYRQALETRLKTLGEDDPETATSMNQLALVYELRGDFASAEPLLRRAIEIRKATIGEEHPDTASSLSNLAAVYHSMGDKAQAESLFQQALAIRRKVLGDDDLDTAESLNNLSAVYERAGDYAKCKPLLEQALAIQLKILPSEHRQNATARHNLGYLYQQMGEYAEAEPLMKQALETQTKLLGPEHPETAHFARTLGFLYVKMADFARAEPLLKQAVELHTKVLGKDHPTTAISLNKLAAMYHASGDPKKAEPLAYDAVSILSNHLKTTFATQSERQKLLMLDNLRVNLDLWLSVAREAKVSSRRLYSQLLAWKGIVFVSEIALRATERNAETAELFAQYQETSRQLATLALAVPENAEKRTERDQLLAHLTERRESIEQSLSRLSADFEQRRQVQHLTPQELQDTLDEDVALLDFFQYDCIRPAAGQPGEFTTDQHLLVFIVRKGQPLAGLDYGPIAPIAELVDRWRSCYGEWTGPADEDPGKILVRRLWQPLAERCRSAKTVLISPDGPIARLPFVALPGEQPGQYLVHEYALATIPVPQLLPQLFAKQPAEQADQAGPPSLLVVGNVDYGGSHGKAGGAASRSLDSVARSSMLAEFPKLATSFDEITSVSGRFRERYEEAGQVKTLDRLKATEAAFRQFAPQHRWLHLATHGFFAPPKLKAGLARPDQQADAATLVGRSGISNVHPGLLSGLALAGANVKPELGEDDGILTALEVSSLDLTKVDVAVLSACETGLGSVAGGEGLLGLQRAFQVSGAKTVVASLWTVPDRATMLLMQRFYGNLWEENMPTLAAFREAQLWMLSDPSHRGFVQKEAPAARAEKSELLPPKYWAAFVLSGDWR